MDDGTPPPHDPAPSFASAPPPPPGSVPVSVRLPSNWSMLEPPTRWTPRQALAAATSTSLAGSAAALGVVLELLRPAGPPGIGVLLSTMVALGGIAVLASRRDLALASQARWLAAVPIVCGAAGIAARTSPTLTTLNVLMMLGGTLLLAVRMPRAAGLLHSHVAQLVVAGAECAINGVVTMARVGRSVRTLPARRAGATRVGHAREVLIGVAIAAPLLAIFGGLFAAADAGFAHLVGDAFDWHLGSLASHVGWAALLAVCALYVLSMVLVGARSSTVGAARRPWASSTVLGTVLGSLALLFVAFLALQASYLFGGADYLERTSGLSAAEYARHGFFELVAATMLVLPVVWGARALASTDPGARRVLRIGGTGVLALTLPLVASSMHRLWMYQERFGLTELRIYVAATLVWMAIVVVAAARATAAESDGGLALAVIVAAFAVAIVLDVMNPDAMIARVNLDRTGADIAYLGELSADALPEVARAGKEERRPALVAARRQLERELRRQHSDDWRSWNLGRARAELAVGDD